MDKGLRRLVDAVATSRLCYGEPVREGERTIIPVVGPDGSRFVEIPDPDRTQNVLKAGAKAFGTVLTAVAGARALAGGAKRRPAGLLGRGR